MTSKTEKQLNQLIDVYQHQDHTKITCSSAEHRNVVEREPRRLREDPVAFMMNLGLYYQGTGWRGYKSYIGNKVFYPEFSTRMKAMVLSSKRVQEIIDELANRQSERLQLTQNPSKMAKLSDEQRSKLLHKQRKALRRELEAVAKGIAEKCVAKLDDIRFIRFFAFTVNNILVRLYHQGIHIKESEWVELKRVALIAQEKKQSLILVPSHKSHIDYLVVSYLMFRLGLQIPHIVAGDNLDLPIVGSVLKNAGAFYIRREWGDDLLYKTILEEYTVTLLSEGMNFECFVEGTRSRLGKLLQPKLGIIKIILEAMINERFSDCHIVPISIGYDKIIETSSYANELLGNPKEKESLWGIITNTRLLQLKWGRVDVRLGKPYSLRGWLEDQQKKKDDRITPIIFSLHSPMDLTDNSQKAILLKSLGYRILSDINNVCVVMPSALVGTVILTLRGRGVGRSELIRRVDWLTRIIAVKGGQVSEFHGMSTGAIVDRTVAIHKDLIGEHKGKDILEPTFYGINPFELSYYRNQVIHLFVEEAIVCAALYTVIKKGGGKAMQRMKYDEMLEEISFLSSLLKLDMIYKPGGVENNTQRTVQWLVDNQVIEVDQEGWVGLSDVERQCGRENYDFLCFLIWPFVESYWLAGVSLFSLAPPNINGSPAEGTIWVESKLFEKRSQALGKTLYYQGDLSYLEAVNKETLSNAMTRFEEQGVIVKRRHFDRKQWSEISLHDDYIPQRLNGVLTPRGHLWELVERIGKFRREGKNRRDNATVSTRVIRLADILGEDNLQPSANQKALMKKRTQENAKL
ncbi:putative acyltransferase [Halteromyces radiatus]|uniref:putative acyltransferase n=1 Tax=Halteromyces radiatus TaxID=101107 RepID=UPI002220941C|nr:putative acyltransferase [Halteromyces radiatus]KAI8098984.1 putative acyltransferase [Halteromyces radiatus]